MGDNSYKADDTLIKHNMHNHNMFIYIQLKLHEIPSLRTKLWLTTEKSLKLRKAKD